MFDRCQYIKNNDNRMIIVFIIIIADRACAIFLINILPVFWVLNITYMTTLIRNVIAAHV